MRIDFETIEPVTMPGMNGGSGEMTVRMVNDEKYRICTTVLHPHSSIGIHAQSSGDDMNIINTFCKGLDWTGKKVHIFATSMTSGIGKTAEKLKPFLNGAEIVDAVKSAEEI